MSIEPGPKQLNRQNDLLNRQYQHLVENSTNAIIFSEPHGKIVFANQAAGDLFGMTSGELILGGRNALISPDDRDLKYAVQEINRTGYFTGHLTLKRKDGTRFPAEISASAFTYPGGRTRQSIIIRDVTRRKKTEHALHESEIRYRRLFENITSGVAVYEPRDNGRDFIVKDLNRAGENLLKTQREQAIDKSVFEVWPGIIEFGLLHAFNQVITTGRPAFFPATLYRDENLAEWFKNEVYPLPSGEIVSVFENVTEQKKDRDALVESERRFRLVTQAVNDGLALVSATGEILTWNKGAENISGIKAETVVGKKADAIDWPVIHENGTKYRFEEFIPVKAIQTGKYLDRAIVGVVRPSGSLRWVSINTTPMFSGKEKTPYVFGVSFSDITVLRTAKESLETQVKLRTQELEDMNATLTVLLQKRDRDIQELEEKVLSNCEEMILPLLNKLKNNFKNPHHQALATVIEKNLCNITSPFSKKMSHPMKNLSPAEIQIAGMIRQGLSNKEIAQILNNSVRTITNHRDNIRRKLELRNKKINLRTFLSSF